VHSLLRLVRSLRELRLRRAELSPKKQEREKKNNRRRCLIAFPSPFKLHLSFALLVLTVQAG
jgi:hypothetical protein